MVIDGKSIADEVKEKIAQDVSALKKNNIHPHLAVILVGDDPSSQAYVRQKKKVGEGIGVDVSTYVLPHTTPVSTLTDHVKHLNKDPEIHGIIIQRPLPLNIPKETLDIMVDVQKDVDGFHPLSPFVPPVATAVFRILEWVHKKESSKEFFAWLREKNIVIVGRGETAGAPIAHQCKKHTIPYTVVHHGTQQKETMYKQADIIISCVGKSDIVRHQDISKKTILIGVGLHTEHEKLLPDYDQEQISQIAGYYTPVPGGVGPVNVACLFENIVIAADHQRNLI